MGRTRPLLATLWNDVLAVVLRESGKPWTRTARGGVGPFTSQVENNFNLMRELQTFSGNQELMMLWLDSTAPGYVGSQLQIICSAGAGGSSRTGSTKFQASKEVNDEKVNEAKTKLMDSFRTWLEARYAAMAMRQALLNETLRADTEELREVLLGLKKEDLADVEFGIFRELKRLSLVAADRFIAEDPSDDFYVEEPVKAPDNYHFTLTELEGRCQDDDALKEMIKKRIKELAAYRKRVKHGYIGITIHSPSRWRTYRQCRKSSNVH